MLPTPKFRPTLPTPKFYGPTPPTPKFQPAPPTSPTPKCYGPTLPTPPTLPTHPRHPYDLADSMSSISPDLYEEILRKAIGFKSLRVNCSDVTQVISKMQMSTTVSQTLTYYLIQSNLFKR